MLGNIGIICSIKPSYKKDTDPSECILEGWSISLKSGTGFFLDAKWGHTPHIDDKVELFTVQGSTIRGVNLNNNLVFYKSDETLEEERQAWLKANDERKQLAFEKEKANMDADFEALPYMFQKRILGFRANNPNFRVDFEGYELFCCKEAMKIVTAIPNLDAELLKKFKDLDYETQRAAIPTLDDGHSGNTFGCACTLALAYATDPSYVTRVHGALSPLVGSKEYGDISKEELKAQEEKAAAEEKLQNMKKIFPARKQRN